MDAGLEEKNKSKKKRRSRRKKRSSQPSGQPDAENPSDGGNGDKNNKNTKSKKKRNRNRDDRYYGRFHCMKCNRHWDSAHVYTIAGTKKVKFKQRCQKCVDSWLFPYHLQILKCSQCCEHPCTCLCEVCQKLKHKRFVTVKTDNGDEETVVNTDFSYCRCEKGKTIPVGINIDPRKKHPKELCEKCLKGRPCVFSDDGLQDNEP